MIHRVPQGLHLQEYYKYKASLPVFADPFLCSAAVNLLVFLFSLKYMKTTIMTPAIPATMIMIECSIAKPPLPFVASVIIVIVVVVVDVVVTVLAS